MTTLRKSVSVLDRPKIDQVGEIMTSKNIFKIAKMFELPGVIDKVEPTPNNPEVIIKYHEGNEYHEARVADIGRNGVIVCSYCTLDDNKRIAWCPHIQYLARTHQDVQLFDPKFHEGHAVEVPVVPTDGIFLSVFMKPFPLANDDERYTDIVVRFMPLDDDDGEVTFSIGQLCRLFGLRELRDLIVDFLEGWLSNPDYFRQIDLDSVIRKGSSRVRAVEAKTSPFVNRFYLATMGMTLPQWKVLHTPDDDAPSW